MPPPTRLVALAPRDCEVCRRRDGLRRCSACQAVYYCGREHQLADRDRHRVGCAAVKRALARLRREEQLLRDNPGDIFTPADVFNAGVGHFWGIFETRPYMRARFGVVDELLQHFGAAGGRADVVRVALDHLLDMLRLCRSDNMGLRDLIPALYIRLDQDQAAYDFIKWYATAGKDSSYDWGNMDLPFLDVKYADILEPSCELWCGRFSGLSHAVTAALLKVRALLCLQAVQNAARVLRGILPPEIVHLVRARLVGNIVSSRPDILRCTAAEVTALIQETKRQARQLHRAINTINPHFWPLMLNDPLGAMAARPEGYSPGTSEEACLMLGYTFAAWVETPGGLDVIQTLSEAPGRTWTF